MIGIQGKLKSKNNRIKQTGKHGGENLLTLLDDPLGLYSQVMKCTHGGCLGSQRR